MDQAHDKNSLTEGEVEEETQIIEETQFDSELNQTICRNLNVFINPIQRVVSLC